MEPQINEPQSSITPLKKITPFSKYLAMTLFIILPFLGGWIGYTYAPEKVFEVDKVVVKDVEKVVVNEVEKNFLSALSIKKGDVFNTMVVEEVSSYFTRNEDIKTEPSVGDISVKFLGETTLVGTLTIDTNFDFISDFIPESMKKLPRLDNDYRSVWFSFLNPEILQSANLINGDRVEVVIDEYIYNFAPTEASNEARIVKITKID